MFEELLLLLLFFIGRFSQQRSTAERRLILHSHPQRSEKNKTARKRVLTQWNYTQQNLVMLSLLYSVILLAFIAQIASFRNIIQTIIFFQSNCMQIQEILSLGDK